ncbi:MAG: helix-turn-helix domain-containing protein [Lachnospiraceae bacterium]|nr:helix-turn-helix domain-containing protein [Lachnospiraceae bacterium]
MKFADKIRLIRKKNKLTQEEFAKSIGTSRGNLSNIELGNVSPTPMLITCVSLKYNVDSDWLMDDLNDDLSYLNGCDYPISIIMEKYDLLDDPYKKFIEHQITELLEIQKIYENKQSQNFEYSKPFPDIPDTLEECLEKYPPTDPDPEDGPDSNIS